MLHMRDLGFLVGEFQTAFLQEVSHERLDLVTEEFLRDARDQEVIRIADQVDFRIPMRYRDGITCWTRSLSTFYPVR